MAKETNDTNVTESSGNVFADLGFPNADREQLKAKLKLEIYRAIKDRGFTQTQAGKILGIQQPHVSALMNGRSGNYSLGRLFEFLNALGRDVEIVVRPKAPGSPTAHTSMWRNRSGSVKQYG
jgi:predicted XRE-type DNA-binding protein